MTRTALRSVATLVLGVLTTACFGGLGFDQPETVSLAPYPLTVELPAGFEARAGPGASIVLESAEDARVVRVIGGGPGGSASTRTAAEILPGASLELEASSPCVLDGMSGLEMRVRELAPEARTHWIAVLDTRAGVVFLDVGIDADVHTTPSGDVLWNTLRASIRAR